MNDQYDPYRYPLSDFFPLTFPQHKGKWETLWGKCNNCREQFPDKELKGYVVPSFRGVRPEDAAGSVNQVPQMYRIFAKAKCQCGCVTQFQYKLNEDMSIEGFSPDTGKWSRWGGTKKEEVPAPAEPEASYEAAWWEKLFFRFVTWLTDTPKGEEPPWWKVLIARFVMWLFGPAQATA
jgi:hypothetical protein